MYSMYKGSYRQGVSACAQIKSPFPFYTLIKASVYFWTLIRDKISIAFSSDKCISNEILHLPHGCKMSFMRVYPQVMGVSRLRAYPAGLIITLRKGNRIKLIRKHDHIRDIDAWIEILFLTLFFIETTLILHKNAIRFVFQNCD